MSTPTRTKRPQPTKPLAKKWEKLLRLIPGYDPFVGGDGCWFDPIVAQRALDFFPECICHAEGDLAGQPFILEPWEKSIVANLFGWMKRDRLGRVVRRYRECLIYIGRKNGKTPLIAAIALYVFFCDGEQGAQCYVAAGEREQAGMLFRHAKFMIEHEPNLSSRCSVYGGNASAGQSKSIVNEKDGSFVRVISADADTKHGGNTHLAIVDELHVQPNRNLIDVLRTSMSSQNRKQPLAIYITTADFKRASICNEIYGHAKKVRDGTVTDPAFLPVIFEASADDDWSDPKTWAKANPNLGVSKSYEYMERECSLAKQDPANLNTFLRLDLNIQTDTDVAAIPMDKWDKGNIEFEESKLYGFECMGGLDLSSTTDVSALVLLFKPKTSFDVQMWKVVCRFWIPAENAKKRSDRDRVPYESWIKQGLITAHEGNRLDYGMIRKDINELTAKFQIQKIAIDPWNATQLMLELQGDGIEMVQFRQGFATMSSPTKEVLAMIAAEEIQHGGNPVLRWMASNASTLEDPAGNKKWDKSKSTDRIDGIVSMTMARGLFMGENSNENVSVHTREKRGFTMIG